MANCKALTESAV